MRPLPHFERRVSHSARNRAEVRQEWGGQGTGGHPLKGQRCSFGRQPSLGPRRRRWAVGEAVSLATPALCMSRQKQTLCHSAAVGRDDRATEATPASYRRWGDVGTASFLVPMEEAHPAFLPVLLFAWVPAMIEERRWCVWHSNVRSCHCIPWRGWTASVNAGAVLPSRGTDQLKEKHQGCYGEGRVAPSARVQY